MLIGAALAMTAPSKSYAAPSGGDLSLDLRQNVVRVTARWKNGAAYDGFGFLVGARAGTLYVVTADHVVRGDSPDAIDQNPKVTFFGDKGAEYTAELLATRLTPAEGDIAILRLPAPAGFVFRRAATAPARTPRGASVWFVGLLRDWFVPSRSGSVNRVEPNGSIVVEGLNVKVGTSGAPLISAAGIVGMVVADTGMFARATPVDLIERAVKDWGYPWELTAASDAGVHDCDRLASYRFDPLKPAEISGVDIEHIDVSKALPACREAVENYAATARFAFQLGRVYQADHKLSDASVWYRRAADAGYAAAQTNLAVMYQHGRGGLPKNEVEAARLYRLAAAHGSTRAQSNLGYMYQHGLGGLAPNDMEALRLYRLAAEQGNPYGQMNLGRMYEEGRGGLAVNLTEALRLYRLAAAQDQELARRAIERVRNIQMYGDQGRWRYR